MGFVYNATYIIFVQCLLELILYTILG